MTYFARIFPVSMTQSSPVPLGTGRMVQRLKGATMAACFWGICAGAFAILPNKALAASLIPDESFCEFGCDIPSFQELVPDDEIPLPEIDNPLRLLSPFQDFIGELEDGSSDTDDDSEWRSPRPEGSTRP